MARLVKAAPAKAEPESDIKVERLSESEFERLIDPDGSVDVAALMASARLVIERAKDKIRGIKEQSADLKSQLGERKPKLKI